MSNKTTVKLEYPIHHGGVDYTELEFRRPKLRDLKKSQAKKSQLDQASSMMADLAEVAPGVIDELDPVDLKTCSDLLGEFMGGFSA